MSAFRVEHATRSSRIGLALFAVLLVLLAAAPWWGERHNLRLLAEIFANALLWRLDGAASEEIGRRLAARFDSWAVQMPFTPVWQSLARYEIRLELTFIKRCLLRSPEARHQFGERLVERFPDDHRLPELLLEVEYFSAGRPS